MKNICNGKKFHWKVESRDVFVVWLRFASCSFSVERKFFTFSDTKFFFASASPTVERRVCCACNCFSSLFVISCDVWLSRARDGALYGFSKRKRWRRNFKKTMKKTWKSCRWNLKLYFMWIFIAEKIKLWSFCCREIARANTPGISFAESVQFLVCFSSLD